MILYLFLVIFSISAVQAEGAKPHVSKVPFKKLCPPILEAKGTCSGCTLRQWAKKIATLKERPAEISSLPTKDTYQTSILTLQELLDSIETCVHTIENQCKDTGCWLNRKTLQGKAPEIFNIRRAFFPLKEAGKNFIFKPYAQRLIVPPGSTVIFFGDLHGSVHSLVRTLLKLHRDGIISDTFKIQWANTYMVFLGDYVDRGIYGTEVIYTLMQLKNANPDHVLMVRGNHEEYGLGLAFARKYMNREPKEDAPSFLDELDRKFGISCKDETIIYRFYDILPVVLYLGCQDQEHVNFIQCCHGGLEIGYDPQSFLQAGKTVNYDLIEVLWRKKHFYRKLTEQQQHMIKKNFDIPTLCSDIVNLVPRGAFYTRTATGQSFGFGFMWNDFYTDPQKEIGPRNWSKNTRINTFGGWVYGKELSQALLSWGNSKTSRLHAILRAHQHNNETGGPMLNLLCCNKGIVNVWGENMVYTLVSSPDAKLEETGERCFTYDSYCMLTTARSFNEWKFSHYFQDGSVARRKWQKVPVRFGSIAAPSITSAQRSMQLDAAVQ